ncbi:hypothetical protein ACMD2_08043 [Ananas comosus]|uniref:Uncharacterized protein n=1 Tax=Ananas comosus TaxID=4615 RepID=A0A199W7W5_ANACO|nr:hypothetical protein ACMD2_08043 [Ananas comosus]
MMAQKKHFLHLFLALVLFFLSCLFLPSFAAALSRSLALRNQDSPALQVLHQEARNIRGEIERMDIEINDYPGSGANNRHDPKSPGRE